MIPQESIPIVSPVTIHWNDRQIPFIEANSDEDLAVALGLVHAHLRLAQLEVMRRVALGRVAEMIGPLGIEIDRSLRLMSFGRAVPKIIATLSEPTRIWAEGFIRGINHHLVHTAKQPHEFKVLGITPEPWTLTDLFTLARLHAADITWLVWSRLLRVRARMDPKEWATLWPRLLASDTPSTFAATADTGVERAFAAATRSGSNSAAVSAARSASNASMIASDPHLPLGLPNPWLIAGVHSPGYHVVGLMVPGLPFIALGRNRWIAWGGTNLHAQASDLFDISELPAHVMVERGETIRVRWSRRRRLRLRESPLGPVVSDGPLLRTGRPAALRWIGHEASNEIGAMLAVARAQNWEEFRAALSGFAVSGLSMVFAGADGRVGHCLAAHVPRRPPGNPPDIIQSPTAVQSWNEITSGADLPMQIDPREGFVASANERPNKSTFPIGFFFAPDDRAERIRALLGGNAKLTPEALHRLQQDVLMPGALPLRDLLLKQLTERKRPAPQQHARDLLASWDGSYDHTQIGALVFELLLAEVVRSLGKTKSLKSYQAVWTTQTLFMEDLKDSAPEDLRRAVEDGLSIVARRLRYYRHWGAVHEIRLRHPFGHVPLLGQLYRHPTFPADGGNNTLNKSGHGISRGRHAVTYGACARHVSDLVDLDVNAFVLLGGQDGWLGSANFADQVDLWRRGEYIEVPLRPESARVAFRHKTVLRPAPRG